MFMTSHAAHDGGSAPSSLHTPHDEDADFPSTLLTRPVLVVEDEVMIAWMVESLLEDMGFSSISIASSGEEAISMASRLPPALVVSDINLGTRGMDGIAAAAAMRKAWNPLVMFVTGHAGQSEVSRIASDVPGAVILRKPVVLEELRGGIRRLAAALFRRN